MQQDFKKGRAIRNLIRRLSFIMIGICAFIDPFNLLNPYRMVTGALIGLLLGWLFLIFQRVFLGLFNGKFKKENGIDSIRYPIESGMLFLTPFAVMLAVATLYLGWTENRAFVAAGIMAVGTAVAMEMSKLTGKHTLKNTIATSGVSFAFSFLWTIGYVWLAKVPGIVEGGIGLIRGLIAGGGGI